MKKTKGSPEMTSKTPEHLTCRNTGVHHVGLQAKDPAAAAEFYRDILGMQIVGGSGPEHPLGATAFLCSRPDEESHEIALFAKPENAHVAFKVASLADLKSLHARVLQRAYPSNVLSTTAFHSRSISTIPIYNPLGGQ
jgi:catechol-2,3-dioxygenase